jgi:hypothetical protein
MFGQVLHMRACARARLLAVAFSRGSLCLRSRPTQGPSPTMVLVARLHALASACERFRACALTRACERSLARALTHGAQRGVDVIKQLFAVSCFGDGSAR